MCVHCNQNHHYAIIIIIVVFTTAFIIIVNYYNHYNRKQLTLLLQVGVSLNFTINTLNVQPDKLKFHGADSLLRMARVTQLTKIFLPFCVTQPHY